MEKANHVETKNKIFSYLEKMGWEQDENGLHKIFYGGYKGTINPLGKRNFHIGEEKINNGYFLTAYFGPTIMTRISLEYPTILPEFPETMDLQAIALAFDNRINKYAESTKVS